jgi:NAD(P)-dependent dehydrogenase (short-subunit alcohol dehydrogenase family)
MKRALVIGNSDGIGLEVTRALLREDYAVVAISRRAAPIAHERYVHVVQDVAEPAYRDLLSDILSRHPDLDVCIYCAGIGGRLDLDNLASDVRVFQVNLMAAVVTTELVLGHMIRKDAGHFIGLSSIGDVLTSAETPSYCASKAGLSHYWEGLASRSRRAR